MVNKYAFHKAAIMYAYSLNLFQVKNSSTITAQQVYQILARPNTTGSSFVLLINLNIRTTDKSSALSPG